MAALAAAAPRFEAADRTEKLRLLDALARLPIRHPRILSAFHEALCFLAAYPDDVDVLRLATDGLAQIAARVRALGPAAARLNDTGIAGTTLDYPFGLPMTRWLARAFPRDADVVWSKVDAEAEIEEALGLLVLPIEAEALSEEGGLGWRRWLALARGDRAITDLALIVELIDRAALPDEVRERLFDGLGLPIGWRVDGRASRTLARLPWPAPFFHGAARPAIVRPDAAHFRREILRPLAMRPAERELAHALIEAARAAMVTRLRELFAFSYANPGDVLVAEPGRGLLVALIGIAPRQRLPLHGYYAYLVLKNGVPISYGAGWQLGGVLEAAFNVFDSFRRGESAFVVSQVLRAYRAAFGMRAIVVDPYQIGHQNAEALASGAFYFYRRLGFRPRDAAVERLAQGEDARILAEPAYRTPRATLARLATSELWLPLDREAPVRLDSGRLAARVTREASQRFAGDRAAVSRRAAHDVIEALDIRHLREWSADERRGLDALAPVIAAIPDLARWPAADRRRLVAAIRAKGGESEAAYVRAIEGIARLGPALAGLASPPPSRVSATRSRSTRAR